MKNKESTLTVIDKIKDLFYKSGSQKKKEENVFLNYASTFGFVHLPATLEFCAIISYLSIFSRTKSQTTFIEPQHLEKHSTCLRHNKEM